MSGMLHHLFGITYIFFLCFMKESPFFLDKQELVEIFFIVIIWFRNSISVNTKNERNLPDTSCFSVILGGQYSIVMTSFGNNLNLNWVLLSEKKNIYILSFQLSVFVFFKSILLDNITFTS